MPIDRMPPNEEQVERWFGKAPDVPDGTFEFALVLGGTVSAGAYTAGAMDFLVEALDCLYDARAAGGPTHDVILKVIAGTSGGGVNAAIACRALAYDFPHVTRATTPGESADNPFYSTWINQLRLDGFLDTSDIGKELVSLLNGKPIDDGTASVIRYARGPAKARPWVGAPLRTILTLTSLRGVPYRTNFGNKLAQGYVDHADFARFALVYPGQPQLLEPRPDEMVLGFDAQRRPQSTNWQQFGEFAKATAAFPIGFPPRSLSRPTEHYRWRPVPYPPFPGQPNGYLLNWPDWDAMVQGGDVPDDWHFLAVDGGATDNEPIQLARAALSGLLERNPRKAETAKRAVWLIDPFAGEAPLGPDGPRPFPAMVGSVATTLTQQTRYSTADLLMAGDNNIYSRFMLTPTRGSKIGGAAIASSGLGAFIGFACQDFMRFDYLLARQNCQQFLRETFLLADDNPLFDDWTPELKEKFRTEDSNGRARLPIIPLLGDASIDETLDPWPKGRLNPEIYRDAIEARFRSIFELELSGSLVRSILSWVGAHATQSQAADYVMNSMRAYLDEAGL